MTNMAQLTAHNSVAELAGLGASFLPEPPQSGQVEKSLPPFAPVPEQAEHFSTLPIVIFFSQVQMYLDSHI